MHNILDQQQITETYRIFMKGEKPIKLTFISKEIFLGSDRTHLSIWYSRTKKISIFHFRAFDMVFVMIFFFTKMILYFKMYKYVSETLNIPKLEKNVKRKKIKRVNIQVCLSNNCIEISFENRSHSLHYGQT